MSLLVQKLSLINFRNAQNKNLVLGEGTTILIGPNAAGKTNTIEALQLLTTGTSFRHARATELLFHKKEQGRASMRLEGDGRVVDVECNITTVKKTFKRNGKACRAQDLLGTLMSVLFCPDDLSIIKSSASHRRGALDYFGSQAHKGYDNVVRTYTRAIEQRNALLKNTFIDTSLLNAWDESIALGGATLLIHRINLFKQLVPLIQQAYTTISGGEILKCIYQSTISDNAAQLSRDQLQEMFYEKLQHNHSDDIRRQQTLLGPHRDDLSFTINGVDARTYGSQGQQRSIILAWKMAEVQLAQQLIGEKPLLLLDDVMSELDENRREAMLSFISQGIQTVITTTNASYFSADLLEQAKVINYGV
ncbi:DNA replication/repair protein RecF [Atopobium fossor]|uniref:DNA replication/repair protein RecF n=1 Tax=Atopobium fossor TaxID=39487 RepID=UPI00041946CA|nr:DNA replication/repair protein RecF [Atopobium fossor]